MTDTTLHAVRGELAPSGILRVGLNHANFLLVSQPAPDAVGVAPDLGRALAAKLDVAVRFVGYANAGLAADGGSRDEWDVAFIGSDPAREGVIAFSRAYVEIDATYLVPAGSMLSAIDEVDTEGVRIAVAERSAYDLYLRRAVKRARLVHADSIPASRMLFEAQRLEALAGLRPRLIEDQKELPGSCILDGRFMAVQQAIATRRSDASATAFVAAFARDIARTGLLASLIARHHVRGLTLATAD